MYFIMTVARKKKEQVSRRPHFLASSLSLHSHIFHSTRTHRSLHRLFPNAEKHALVFCAFFQTQN